jgi:hypothetical protein
MFELDLKLNSSRAANRSFLWATIKQKIVEFFLAFAKNKESTMPLMTLHTIFFLSLQFPTGLHHLLCK